MLIKCIDEVLRDCEDLFKAIQSSKDDAIDNVIDRYVNDDEPEVSYYWCQLRHYIGRLHSYRQASEIIVKASEQWSSLFKNVTVKYIRSSHSRKVSPSRRLDSSTNDAIATAFPEHNLSHYASDIAELRKHGLDEEIQKQEQIMPSKTQVHCEMHLHNHLVKQGKTRPSDFWNDTMFIATSKPTCRLCYYYFQDDENEFHVQPPHMNLYPKCRLPDVDDSNDEGAIVRHEHLMTDILEQMQIDTLKILQMKHPQWKRNDSRTDSRNWTSTLRDNAGSRDSILRHHIYPPPDFDEDSFVDVGVAQ